MLQSTEIKEVRKMNNDQTTNLSLFHSGTEIDRMENENNIKPHCTPTYNASI